MNFFKLRKNIQAEITAFSLLGLIAFRFIVAKYEVHILSWLQVDPETPIRQVENGGWLAIGVVLTIIAVLILFLFLSAVMHALFLSVTGRLDIKRAIKATVFRKYPSHWYRW